jgi:3-deoxy-7-phosphoheptulonate synthase
MIEVHPDPENAAVDPLQSINFADFKKLMKQMDKTSQAVSRNIL